jgi:hypothetical protein
MSGLIKIKFKTDQGDDVEYFQEGTSNAEMRERIAEIKAAKSQKSVIEDVATQLGVGAAEGTAGLADATMEAADILTQLSAPMLNPGLVQNAAASVLDFVGADETAEQFRRMATPREYMKPGQAALDAVGLDPEMIQPTTALGGYSRTFGNFLPGVVSGPGGLARRLRCSGGLHLQRAQRQSELYLGHWA